MLRADLFGHQPPPTNSPHCFRNLFPVRVDEPAFISVKMRFELIDAVIVRKLDDDDESTAVFQMIFEPGRFQSMIFEPNAQPTHFGDKVAFARQRDDY